MNQQLDKRLTLKGRTVKAAAGGREGRSYAPLSFRAPLGPFLSFAMAELWKSSSGEQEQSEAEFLWMKRNQNFSSCLIKLKRIETTSPFLSTCLVANGRHAPPTRRGREAHLTNGIREASGLLNCVDGLLSGPRPPRSSGTWQDGRTAMFPSPQRHSSLLFQHGTTPAKRDKIVYYTVHGLM